MERWLLFRSHGKTTFGGPWLRLDSEDDGAERKNDERERDLGK